MGCASAAALNTEFGAIASARAAADPSSLRRWHDCTAYPAGYADTAEHIADDNAAQNTIVEIENERDSFSRNGKRNLLCS